MPEKVITGLTNGQLYGFRMFPRNMKNQYQTRMDRGTAKATPRAVILLSSIPEGGMVKLTENGAGVNFYVAKHDYESGLNGAGRTLVVRKDLVTRTKWEKNVGRHNYYSDSTVDIYLNNTYFPMLNTDLQELIGETAIYYTPYYTNAVTTLTRKVFLLSMAELGFSVFGAGYNKEGSSLPIYTSLLVVYMDGVAYGQWTRSPYTSRMFDAWCIESNGGSANLDIDLTRGARPAFTLPSTMQFNPAPNSDGSYSPL